VEAKPKIPGLLSEVSEDLELVEGKIRNTLENEDALLNEVALHLLKAGGKRLRPALVLLAGKFNSYDLEKLVPLAAAVELIHMATLVHDDVIDGAFIRRGWPTINAKWNEEISILIGDYLFAHAFSLLSAQGDNRVVNLMAKVVYEMSTGEIDQLSSACRLDQSERDYLERIEKKTSLFIAKCCELGALASGASVEHCQALERYGYGVGMGYQIIDDILDFTSTAERLGKPVGSDLRGGVLTLPVIYSLRVSKERDRLALLLDNPIGEEEIEEVVSILKRSGSFDYSYDMAGSFISQAKEQLMVLPEGSTRNTLREVADFVLRRDF